MWWWALYDPEATRSVVESLQAISIPARLSRFVLATLFF